MLLAFERREKGEDHKSTGAERRRAKAKSASESEISEHNKSASAVATPVSVATRLPSPATASTGGSQPQTPTDNKVYSIIYFLLQIKTSREICPTLIQKKRFVDVTKDRINKLVKNFLFLKS